MSSNDEENLVIYRSRACYTVLNRFPYNAGHLLVAPYRAVVDLTSLSDDETMDLWQTVKKMTTVLQDAFQPKGMNIGINIGAAAGAGVPQHLHVHIVPRWPGDTNFVTTVGGMRVHPNDLATVYKTLKERLSS